MPTSNQRKFLLFLLLFTLLSLSFSQQNSSPPPMPKMPKEPLKECISNELFYDCSVCACFPLQTRQNTVNLIITIPFAICSLIFIIYYATVKPLREKPGKLVLAISLATFCLTTLNIIENAKPAWSYSNEGVDSTSCLTTGYIKVLSTVLLNYYTIAFFTVYIMTIKNPLRATKIKDIYIHGLALLVSGLIMAALGPLNMIGRTLNGTCGLKSSPGVWMSISTYGFLAISGFIMMGLARRYLVKNNRRSEAEEDFVRHYLLFLGIISNLYLVIGILDTAWSMMLNSLVLDAVKDGEVHLGVGLIFKTLLFNLYPALLLFARLREPMVYEHIKRCSVLCSNKNKGKENDRSGRLSLDLPNSEVALDIKQGLLEKGSETHKSKKLRSLNDLKRENKKNLVCSVLASLNYIWKLGSSKSGQQHKNTTTATKSAYNKAKHFMHYEVVKTVAPQVVRELKRRKNKLGTGDFTVHAQELFDEMIELDNVKEMIQQSWYFVGNYGNLENHGYKAEEDGKISFMSSNAMYVLREISREELKNLLKVLPEYIKYMKENPESMLTRIYGIFSFDQLMGGNEHITMILMKNMMECPEESLRDQYKLGGANMLNKESFLHYSGELLKIKRTGSFKRSFFGGSNNESNILKGLVDGAIRQGIMRILQKDIEFLTSQNLRNYILQVSVVNHKGIYTERLDRSVIREVKEIDEMSENLEDLIDEKLWDDLSPTYDDYNWDIQSFSSKVGLGFEENGGEVSVKMEVQDFWNNVKNRKSDTMWGRIKHYGSNKEEEEVFKEDSKIYGKKFINCIECLL